MRRPRTMRPLQSLSGVSHEPLDNMSKLRSVLRLSLHGLPQTVRAKEPRLNAPAA
jgi:hypothetical protein